MSRHFLEELFELTVEASDSIYELLARHLTRFDRHKLMGYLRAYPCMADSKRKAFYFEHASVRSHRRNSNTDSVVLNGGWSATTEG